ncbi:glycoside hydrolase family 3 protein [Saccharicrinis fermentans]|uniref:beta-glucosidase n=1 Tax=Saccharicrinis fermentans DSM 9555 = JCM 21142 TaxID=869213 RepID=W7YE89_9BACT|nr:glycoside hydrolase family 3 N-terminal domain-containing protein [Saccharicrinis fermentans]GAF02781.1 hypothetical protein JCM21142_41423 [Saccharicrinis fermentans DSM 9555 = JCM 21142]
MQVRTMFFKFILSLLGIMVFISLTATQRNISNIYHKGWIDFNKNGLKDIYEDPSQSTEARVQDLLSQMTIEEKTCQMVTLYGYSRILQDELPTEEWKNSAWKDGIANIDEHLNSIAFRPQTYNAYSYPHSNHAEAINIIQKWFMEETRLGIPVDFTNEGTHGLCHDRATPLPAPIGMGCTWNKSLMNQAGQIIAPSIWIFGLYCVRQRYA